MVLLRDLLPTVADAWPARTAVVVDGTDELTYGEWEASSNAVGRGLRAAGLEPGERVALMVGNGDALQYRVAYFAAQKAGLVTVPVNPRVARRELEHMVVDSAVSAVVAGRSELDRVRSVVAGTAAAPLVIGPGATRRGEHPWEVLSDGDRSPFAVEVDPDQVGDILYTSGTTGAAKGVAATYRSVASVLAPAPFERPVGLLHAIPLATFMATHGIQALVVQYGLTELVMSSFDAARYAELLGRLRPQWLTMVPAHALLLLESGALAGVDTSDVQVVMFGGAPMPPAAVTGLASLFPRATLVNGYGLTESGTTVVAMPPGEAVRRPGAVGKPFDATALRVVDPEGSEVAAGDTGEVALRVPVGQRFYYGDPRATAEAWRGEWLHTGDLGWIDGDGYLHLVDRKKDVIVRGGYNISTIEVEGALHEHPDIVEAAVLGVTHPVLGQDVAAVVRVREGVGLDLEMLGLFLADLVSDYKRPRRLVTTTDPLPRTAMGKLDKPALAAMLDVSPG